MRTQRIAHSVAELSWMFSCSPSLVWRRIREGALAFVRLGGKPHSRVVVLRGDELAYDDADGVATLSAAWRGRHRVRLAAVARALGCSPRTLKTLVDADGFPATRDAATGWWWCQRSPLLEWLRRHRVAAQPGIAA